MKSKVLSVAVVVLLSLAGCTGGTISTSGTGGDSTGGGGSGSGGNVGSGGSVGSGGTTASGGSTGTGGTTASGGVVGSGGATGQGGASVRGGTTGSGGTSSSGGTTASTGGIPGSGGMTQGSGGTTRTTAAGGNAGRDAGPDVRSGTGGTRTGGISGAGGVSATGGATSSGTSTSTCTVGTPLTGGTSHCSSNASGSVGSLQWTIWSSGSGGCLLTYGSSAAFSATWNNSGDFLARVGLSLGSSKTYDQFGTISADFAEKKSGSAGGYSMIGIYGWSVSPLVEYYIIDDWFSGRPGGGAKKGTVTVDGDTYDIGTATRTNQPSIQGTATFQQYFSVRQKARQCGHISITEHFKAWANLGMTLGKMYEAKILVEAGGGVGSIDFTTATITAQ